MVTSGCVRKNGNRFWTFMWSFVLPSPKRRGKPPAPMKKCFIRKHLQTETLVNEEIEIENCLSDSIFLFLLWQQKSEVRFVERIVHRHIVQNSSCRNIIIEQIFAWTGIKFLEKKTTYLTLYSKLNSKETSTPSEAYCMVLNYI